MKWVLLAAVLAVGAASVLQNDTVVIGREKLGTNDVYRSSWFAYPHMLFLLDRNKPRDRLNTENSTEDDENEEVLDNGSPEESPVEEIVNQVLENESPRNEVHGNELPDTPDSQPGGSQVTVMQEPRSQASAAVKFKHPVPMKKAKKSASQKDPILNEALQLMRSSAQAATANLASTTLSPVNLDVKSKEILCMKLLNFILQPTVYEDVRGVAREWLLEDNVDKYMNVDVVKRFIEVYKMGLLPRGEVFVHTNDLVMKEAVLIFRLLYSAVDFDTFIRTACFLRERINGGMFVYVFTCAVFHRSDCRGIYIPPPYEIFPNFFVDSDVINKAMMMKMTKAAHDPALMDYYGIKVTDNMVTIDWRKGVRHTLNEDDRLAYFTEDIDLNALMYYDHTNYPHWMTNEVEAYNKERWGEINMYGYQQYLARLRLERLSHHMCDINMINWNEPLETGYWPKIRLPTGVEMPVRSNDMLLINEHNLRHKQYADDIERVLRDGILNGHLKLRDGKVIDLKKPEDVENLSRLLLGGFGFLNDDAKVFHLMKLLKKILSYNSYRLDKYTYIPTALDTYMTCLRDPVFWRLMKTVTENVVLFKRLLPKYTRNELDFPGVKVKKLLVDDLTTFFDDYHLDITNALYLDETEIKNKKADMVFIAKTRRLNHHPFKITIDVDSDKAVEAVVRVFLGPKYDCMGRLLNLNDKRLHMFEIDNFLYKLETGKNVIVRDSSELHNVLGDRPLTRQLLEGSGIVLSSDQSVGGYWRKSRLSFPHRLLLPLGWSGGLPLQLFVIVSPVRSGQLLPTIDLNKMKDHFCGWSSCIDTMPLGFPFDREIDLTNFFTNNMKLADVKVYRKTSVSSSFKNVDTSDMILKRDDLTYLDSDMLVRWSYRDVMMTSFDNMKRH